MAMPSRYRERLMDMCAGRVVVSKNPYEFKKQYLMLFPLNKWEIFEEKVRLLPNNVELNQIFKRQTIGCSKEIDMDASGRLLLPSEFRELSNLEKNIALVGQGEVFQIWDAAAWKAQEAADAAAMQNEAFDASQLPNLDF